MCAVVVSVCAVVVSVCAVVLSVCAVVLSVCAVVEVLPNHSYPCTELTVWKVSVCK